MDLTVVRIPSTDPRLNRHVVHDPRSRGFALDTPVDQSTWYTHKNRIIDPRPNPNQTIGNCTACAKAMQLNAVGNRKRGVVFDMTWAVSFYTDETAHDQFPGQYPAEDTGSNGLASAQTAQREGVGGEYRWIFGGADQVVQATLDGDVVSVGTKWYNNMFNPDAEGRVTPGGGVAGGHQYAIRGYDVDKDWLLGRCWWGTFRDFWISRTDFTALLADQGDAHVQVRV